MAAPLAALLVFLGCAAAWSRALLRASKSVRAVQIGSAPLVLELASGDRFTAEAASRRYVTRYMVVLPLLKPFRRALLVTADMLEPQEFRQLRIWALWNRLPSERRSEKRGVAAKQLPA
jgi:hypothetical protein